MRGILASLAAIAAFSAGAAVRKPPVEWRAKWIAAAPETRADADLSGAKWIVSAKDSRGGAVFTRRFDCSNPGCGVAELVFATVPRHEVRINGRDVDLHNDGQNRWHALRFLDITAFLTNGVNEISITVRKGPAVPDAGGTCAALARVNLPDGTSFGTDSSWSADGGVRELGGAREPDFARHLVARAESVSPAFEKDFSVDKEVESAVLRVTGVGFYEAYLNGRKIGDKVLDPSPTDYTKRVLFSEYDLTGHDGRLEKGTNTFRLLVGHGWYDVRSVAVWDWTTAPWRDFPRAIAQLEIRYADGSTETVCTDGSWRQVTSPVLYDCIREGEVLTDAGIPPKQVRGHDGRALFACEVEGPKGRLEPELHPGAKVTDEFEPVRVRDCGGGTFVAEFPYDIAGWVRLRLRGQEQGDVVSVRYDERIGDGLTSVANRAIDQFFRFAASHRVCAKDAAFQTDRYICSGRDGETYEPRFTYNGFRYVVLKGLRRKPLPGDLVARRVRTAFDVIGSFDCSDPVFSELVAMGERAYMSNFADGYPTDCPHREKNGWTGDASIASELAQYAFENTAAYRKWLVDLMDTQLPNGDVCAIAPTSGWGYSWGNGPAWDSALPVVAWNLYLYRGDADVLDSVYPALVRYLEFTATKADSGGLVKHGLGDWIPVAKMPSVELTSSCYYYQAQRIASLTAALKGLAGDSAKWAASAERTRRSINAKFCREDGTYDDGGQTAQAFPIAFGVVEPAVRGRCAAKLVESVERTGRHVDMGLLGTKHVFRALSEIGRSDLAYEMIVNPTSPSPADWLRKGGTTLWEDWGDGSSRDHVMFGDFVAWAYQYLGGIRLPEDSRSCPAIPVRSAAAERRVLVAPTPVPGMTRARARIRTPFGELASSWCVADGVFTLEVVRPREIAADVLLPDGTRASAPAGSSSYTCAVRFGEFNPSEREAK